MAIHLSFMKLLRVGERGGGIVARGHWGRCAWQRRQWQGQEHEPADRVKGADGHWRGTMYALCSGPRRYGNIVPP